MVVVLGFLSRQVKIGQMLLPAGLAGLSCFGRPCRRNLLCDQYLKIAEWVLLVVRTYVFYLTVWFQRERFEALLAVNIMEFSFHGVGGEGHESRGRWKSNGDRILVVRWNWLGAS